MRPLTTLLVLAALAVGAAGCGGGSNSAADTSATTTTESTTTQETEATEATDTEMTETSTTESTSTEASGGSFASADCRKLIDAGRQVAQALSAASTDKEKLEQTKDLYQTFVDEAPSDIKPDLQVLADAYSKIVDQLANLDLKPGQTPDAATIQKVQQALASIDNVKVQQASQHIASWTTSHCGASGG